MYTQEPAPARLTSSKRIGNACTRAATVCLAFSPLAAFAQDAELIVNGDFEAGNTGFASEYSFTPGANTAGAQYNILSSAASWNSFFQGGNHTAGGSLFMAVNGASSGEAVVWSEIVRVVPQSIYSLEYFYSKIDVFPNGIAQLELSVNGQVVGPVVSASSNGWIRWAAMWDSGNATSATVEVRDLSTASSGNDFGLDDISFFGPTPTRKVVCVDGCGTEFVNCHEGYLRARGVNADDYFEVGGDLTIHLGQLRDGDELTVVAHGIDGGRAFQWGNQPYAGFGTGPQHLSVPSGFSILQNVSFELCTCWSSRDPDGNGPDRSLLLELRDAMGGAGNGHTGSGYNDFAESGVRWGVDGGTQASRDSARACLNADSSWVLGAPVNRPNSNDTQLTRAQAIVDACSGSSGVQVSIPNAIAQAGRRGYEVPINSTSIASGTSGCICSTAPGCGLASAIEPGSRVGSTYCETGNINSSGQAALTVAIGSNEVGANDFVLVASQLPASSLGYFLASRSQGQVTPPGAVGDLCLSGPISRLNAEIVSGPSDSIVVDLNAMPGTPLTAVIAGETWNFQCWFRDGPGMSNFTDATSVDF